MAQFFLDLGVDEVEKEKLGELVADWLNRYRRTLAPRTTQRRVTSLRCMATAYGLKILEGYTPPSAAAPKPHPLPELQVDLRRMLETTNNEHLKILIVLLGMCGLRISEALAVAPGDISLQDRTVRVRHGKGSQERVVPISDYAWDTIICAVVEAQLNNAPTLLSYADRSARYAITALGKRAGVSKRISSHDLRATFATLTYQNSGNDIRATQELLGHRHLAATQVYVDIAEEALRHAVNFMKKDGEDGDEN